MSMQLAHQLGAAKLLNPAAKASSKMAEVSPTARPPTKSMRAEAVMPIHTVLLRPWRRPKRITALSESHPPSGAIREAQRSEEHTSELQSRGHLVCRLLLEKKKKNQRMHT